VTVKKTELQGSGMRDKGWEVFEKKGKYGLESNEVENAPYWKSTL